MTIALLGKTCSGKTTIRDFMVEKYNYKPIVTYTTRPMRPGEQNGVTYHFISKEVFQEMIKKDEFAEYTSYCVASGDIWYYGTSKKSLMGENGIIILNPDGLHSLKNQNLYSIYINCDTATLKKRLLERGDNQEEASRRLLTDEKDFRGIEKSVSCIICNNNETIEDIARDINFAYLKRNSIGA